MAAQIHKGDCKEVLKKMPSYSIDLVYLDPPFFTQKVHKLGTRDRKKEYSFDDVWNSAEEYSEFLFLRVKELHRVLKETGAVYFHCDHNASGIARSILDEIFGKKMFRSEIIWYYRRWSNSRKGLLPCHQNIYFYTKSDEFKFNEILQEYSPSTNVDQILQKRKRDEFGKAVYLKDENGSPVSSGCKKGVPLGDVWDIPLLNPKAKERIGYPTQKPLLLLERIIQISTDEGDCVLDPFCGSGTTLVAAELLGRNSIGIDVSTEAVAVTKERLSNPVKTDSHLLKAGRESYVNADKDSLTYLNGLDVVPVHRNKGIDALLNLGLQTAPITIRVQRKGETRIAAAQALYNASKSKNAVAMILVATDGSFTDVGYNVTEFIPPKVRIVESTENAIKTLVQRILSNSEV
jgi:site-specific DNA-methyltransferase (adenine-specific)